MKNRSVKQLRQLGYDRFADEIEQLMARVAELESWYQEQGETLGSVALDYTQMKIERDQLKARVEELEGQLEAEEMQSDMFVRRGDAYHERLMAVVAVANERDWADPVIRAFCQRIMTAAGFERCECGGREKLTANGYPEDCPCVANGTTGWREA